MPVAVELDVAIMLEALVAELLCSRAPKFELGIVTIGSAEVESGGMETIVPSWAVIGGSVGVGMTTSDMVRGVIVMSDTDIATAADVGIVLVRVSGSGMIRVLVLVLWTAGAEEGIVKGGKVGVLVGSSTEPTLSALVG